MVEAIQFTVVLFPATMMTTRLCSTSSSLSPTGWSSSQEVRSAPGRCFFQATSSSRMRPIRLLAPVAATVGATIVVSVSTSRGPLSSSRPSSSVTTWSGRTRAYCATRSASVLVGEPGDQPLRGGPHRTDQLVPVHPAQRVGHRRAHPAVLRAVREQQRGPPADQRHQRRIGRHPAVAQRSPAARIVREVLLVAGEMEQLAVADDEPRLDPGRDLDRHHIAVVAAHPLVQLGQRPVQRRPVQRHPRRAVPAGPVARAAVMTSP